MLGNGTALPLGSFVVCKITHQSIPYLTDQMCLRLYIQPLDYYHKIIWTKITSGLLMVKAKLLAGGKTMKKVE